MLLFFKPNYFEKKSYPLCLLLALQLLWCNNIFAQQRNFIFKNYSQEQGLPSNETYYVFEDSKHYIWIGTDQGVVRYNGSNFKLFSLPDNVVFLIKEDRKGRIWFFTRKGYLAFCENEQIKVFPNAEEFVNRVQKIHILQAYFDSQDNLYLNSGTDSNYVISPQGSVQASKIILQPNALSEFSIYNPTPGITNTIRNAYRIKTQADTMLFNVTRQHTMTHYWVPLKHTNFTLYGGVDDSAGNIYFFCGTYLIKLMPGGAFKVKKMLTNILCLKQFEQGIFAGMAGKGAVLLNNDLSERQTNILANKSVSAITSDFEGGIWFSTLESGIFHVKKTQIKQLLIDENLSQNITRMANIRDSILVYSNAEGLHTLKNDQTERLLTHQLLSCSDIIHKNNDLLYFAGGVTYQNKLFETSNPAFKHIMLVGTTAEMILPGSDSMILGWPTGIFAVKNDHLQELLKTHCTGVTCPLETKMILNKAGKLFKDASNTIWCGTKNGLYKSRELHDSLYKIEGVSPLFDNGISCIRQMLNGIMVIGISSGGIVLMQDTLLANITEKDGLLSNRVFYILPLQDDLWVATSKGISVIKFSSFAPVKFTIVNIGQNKGIYNLIINQLVPFQNQVVAATNNGFYFLEKPRELSAFVQQPLPFYVTNINYYKGDTNAVSSISLPHNNTRLLIKFNAISFTSNEAVEYLYRLRKSDTGWIGTTSQELLIENLDPGEYDLELKARIRGEQRTSETIALHIEVRKAWWQLNIVRLLLILITATIVYILIKKRVQKVRRIAKRRVAIQSQLSNLEQAALRSQMNPGFIFNSLQAIQELITAGNRTDASEYLVKFARLIRKTLEFSANQSISVSAETEYLKEYLQLEQTRQPGIFNFDIKLEPNTGNFLIPNLMIQPLLEHCIRKAGKSANSKKCLISVSFFLENENICCTIITDLLTKKEFDNLVEEEEDNLEHFGINTLKKRMAILQTDKININSISLQERQTGIDHRLELIIAIRLPLTKIAP